MTGARRGEVLVVLARAPGRGSGKTRLRSALGGCPDELVDRLVRAMVEDTLAWATADGRPCVVAARGDVTALAELAPAATIIRQGDGEFGDRIERAIAAGFDAGGAGAVVQIGTDSPSLPGSLLDSAFAALAGDDACLVPATDGGWVALGACRPLAGALTAAPIRWSTADAAADTTAALRAAGRRTSVLAPWHDVDDLDGVRRLWRDRAARRRAPATWAAVAALAGEAGLATGRADRPAPRRPATAGEPA